MKSTHMLVGAALGGLLLAGAASAHTTVDQFEPADAYEANGCSGACNGVCGGSPKPTPEPKPKPEPKPEPKPGN